MTDFPPAQGRFHEQRRDYNAFSWALRNADVFATFFDGGFLRSTPLRHLEGPLLRLAGKRVIVSPYGADIAVPGFLGPFEMAMVADYPEIPARAAAVRKRVRYWTRWADLIVRNVQPGFLPRYDVVWPTQVAIDTDRWHEEVRPTDSDQRAEREVVVFHSPNHRTIKGTDHLLQAVEDLRKEGARVRLELMENRPNEEVRDALLKADVVAEQFLAGYALSAIEGLSAGKPVLSNIGWLPRDVRDRPAIAECPIIDSNQSNLKENLRRLVDDQELRRSISESSRRYAVKYHSYEAIGQTWQAVIRHVWRGTQLPDDLRPRAPAP